MGEELKNEFDCPLLERYIAIGYHVFKTFGSMFSSPVTQLPSVTSGYHWFHKLPRFQDIMFSPYVTQFTFGYLWFHRLLRFQDIGSMFSPPVTQLPSVTSSIGSIGYHVFKTLVVYFPLLLPSYLQLPSVTIGSTFSRLLVVCFPLMLPSYLQLPPVTIGYQVFKTLVVYFLLLLPSYTFGYYWFHVF